MTSFLQDRQLTIALGGEIDHHGAKALVQTLQQRIETYLPQTCVLDFRDVGFMDSSGIAVVIAALRQMRQLGGQVELQNVPSQPLRVMQAAGLEKLVALSPAAPHKGEEHHDESK